MAYEVGKQAGWGKQGTVHDIPNQCEGNVFCWLTSRYVRYRWEHNIHIEVREIGSESVKWLHIGSYGNPDKDAIYEFV